MSALPLLTEVRYQLYRTQREFIEDTSRLVAFIGGVGSGKTTAGALRALRQVFGRDSSTLGMVVAPTYRMLADATWRTCQAVWGPLLADVNRSEMRMVLRGGHEVLFRSADDPDRLRGANLHWAWIDEAALCDEETWPVVLGRLRAGGEAGMAWLTTTPKGLNWVHRLVEEGRVVAYHATTMANPFLAQEYIDSLRQQYPSEYARQELLGEFVQLGAGLVRRSWFEVVPRAPEGLRWARYWDLAVSTRASADYTASVRAAERDGIIYLDGLVRGRWEWPETRRIILQTIAAEPDTQVVGIEANAFQLAAVQELLREPAARHVAIRPVTADRDKVARALPWIARAEQGLVKLVAGSRWHEALDEMEAFPEGAHDDVVDAVSGAYALLGGRRVVRAY